MGTFGQELIKSAREASAIARGEAEPGRVFERADVAAIRKKLNLSQNKFAERFGLSASTVRDWEQGRRQPDTSANNYLLVIKYAPDVVERILAGGSSR
jgi:putative transcriptional regulator